MADSQHVQVIRVLGWTTGLAFLSASVLQALLELGVAAPAPRDPVDSVDGVIELLASRHAQLPLGVVTDGVTAVGVVTFALLGVTLADGVDRADAWRRLVATLSILASSVWVTALLLFVGAFAFVTGAAYCDCGIRAEEAAARLVILGTFAHLLQWLTAGALLLAAAAIVIAARIGRQSGLPAAWEVLSLALAASAIGYALLNVTGIRPWNLMVLFVAGGLLLPAWSIWLAIRYRPSERPPPQR